MTKNDIQTSIANTELKIGIDKFGTKFIIFKNFKYTYKRTKATGFQFFRCVNKLCKASISIKELLVDQKIKYYISNDVVIHDHQELKNTALNTFKGATEIVDEMLGKFCVQERSLLATPVTLKKLISKYRKKRIGN